MTNTHPIAKPPQKDTKRKYSYEERHWYLISVEIHYTQQATIEGEQPTLRAQKLNVLITPKKRKITAIDIGDIRQSSLLCIQNRYNVNLDQIADLIILNIMYIGLMSEHTYYTEGQETPTT